MELKVWHFSGSSELAHNQLLDIMSSERNLKKKSIPETIKRNKNLK